MLRTIYKHLLVPKTLKLWFKNKAPISWKRDKHFRKFGSVNELYFWRLDQGIDTVAPIQNYFSTLFPEFNTATYGQVWIFDHNGNEILTLNFDLPSYGMHIVRLSELISREYKYGTFMWHIRIPDSIANLAEIRKNLVYFIDRGYICYEKDQNQPAFIHGVDRFAVFQEQSMVSRNVFYGDLKSKYTWTPEFPVEASMQSSIDIMLLNRTKEACDCSITLYCNGGERVFEETRKIMPRGGSILTLNAEILQQLKGKNGYFKVSGMPTKWGRPAITRHYICGAISVMHC